MCKKGIYKKIYLKLETEIFVLSPLTCLLPLLHSRSRRFDVLSLLSGGRVGERERGRYFTIKNSESVMINKDFYNFALLLVSPLISTPLPDFFNLTSQIRYRSDTDQIQINVSKASTREGHVQG